MKWENWGATFSNNFEKYAKDFIQSKALLQLSRLQKRSSENAKTQGIL